MPALAEAAKLGSKAAKSGFDWPHWRDLLPKLAEETAELEAEAVRRADSAIAASRSGTGRSSLHGGESGPSSRRGRGDGFARLQSAIPPALSRRWSLRRARPLEELEPAELEALWAEAKRKLASTSKTFQPGAEQRCAMILIRNCSGFDELEACVQLQIETWGYDDSEVIPRKAFLLAQKIGGQVIGAFDTDLPGATTEGTPESLVGFAMSLPGVKTGERRTPLLSAFPHAGGAAGLSKSGSRCTTQAQQRLEAISRNIRLMEWTFDPLEIKNAYLNIHKLGAVVRCYRVNFYGVSSSRLQGGLPTDRLVAEWHLNSPRVAAILGANPRPLFKIEERIPVPASIYEWKASDLDRERAMACRMENRRKFQEAFSRGLAVVGFRPRCGRERCLRIGFPNPGGDGLKRNHQSSLELD